MDLRERNDTETQYSDPPGIRALVKGSVATAAGILLTLLAVIAASFGVLPALVLLIGTIPLSIWGVRKMRRNDRQITEQVH